MDKPVRKKRIPVQGSQRNVLTVDNKEPGFEYRWIHNDEQRVQRFLDAGYEVVTKNHSVGDRKVDSSAGTSSVVEKGVGGGKRDILVRIPEEFYKEDQAAKNKAVDESEFAMKKQIVSGEHGGKLELSRGAISQGT